MKQTPTPVDVFIWLMMPVLGLIAGGIAVLVWMVFVEGYEL